MAKVPMTWVIAHISIDRLHTLSRDLHKYRKYKKIEAYVPKAKILKKKFKGVNHYEEVPLMMNYGLFRVPNYFIPNSKFLLEMRNDIECLHSWVTDHSIKSDQKVLDVGYKIYNPIRVAIARDHEVSSLVAATKLNSIYTAKDLDTLYIGKRIQLHGYPFDEIDAEILKINFNKKELEVKLLLEESVARVVKVSFDNVFYTIYQSQYLDTAMKEQSIETLSKSNKQKAER